MSRLPWLLLPLLFLPNLGFLRVTPFGVLEISDFLIWPYMATVALVLLRRRRRAPRPPVIHQVQRLFLFFLSWAVISTMTEGLRYGYASWFEVNFGLLKLGKFALYALAGWTTALLVRGKRDLGRLLWALTAGGAATTLALPFAVSDTVHPVYDSARGFKATNAVSVEVAIVIAFLGVAWASGWGDKRWRRIAPWVLGLTTIGAAFSGGRGGWLAGAVGLIWFLHRRGSMKPRTAAITFVITAAALAAYQKVPVFQHDVTRTLRLDSAHIARYGAGLVGFDEGARLTTWAHEGVKLIDAPILGRGFYNRFSNSGLWWTGSHNFWLQMFLETGLPGGAAILAAVWLLWRDSRRRGILPAEVALVVAFLGGMGGEYFYGGVPLFVLMLSSASIRSAVSASVKPHTGARVASLSPAHRYPLSFQARSSYQSK